MSLRGKLKACCGYDMRIGRSTESMRDRLAPNRAASHGTVLLAHNTVESIDYGGMRVRGAD